MVSVGPRLLACALLLVFASVPASGSLLEDATGGAVAYQFDGATHHDAPDACDGSDPAWGFDAGNSTDGMLVPPDDTSDVFQLNVGADQVGTRLVVSLAEDLASQAPGTFDLLLNVLAPDCDGDVFATHNQPLPPPSPPAPAAGEQQARLARGTAPWYCAGTDQWYFGLDNVGATPPASIYAAWTDGSRGELGLAWSGRQGALYGPGDAGVLLEGAWANLPAGWSGSFVLFAGPCDAPDGGAVYGEPAALGNDWVAFTPVHAGAYEVLVMAAPVDVDPPRSVPLSCHWCAPQLEEASEKVSYNVSARQQD